jgi:hypothetical protein
MTRAQAIAQIRAVQRRCRGPLSPASAKVVKALLSDGRTEQAKRADAVGRVPCGADFNAIVIAGPWDGERHEYTCKKCGLKGTYRAPHFPEIEKA